LFACMTPTPTPSNTHTDRHMHTQDRWIDAQTAITLCFALSTGCLTQNILCFVQNTCASAQQAYCAATPQSVHLHPSCSGAPPAYRADQPWMGLPARLPAPKAQLPCATVVGSALATVLEATLASLLSKEARTAVLSPTHAYYCSPHGARGCTTGWGIEDAVTAVSANPAPFFLGASCAGAGTTSPSAAVCAAAASCAPSPVSSCAVEALDTFVSLQRAVRQNGAVLSSMYLGGDFKLFFERNATGIYNSSVSSDAEGLLRVAIAIVGCAC
jgi:hypothetical protein